MLHVKDRMMILSLNVSNLPYFWWASRMRRCLWPPMQQVINGQFDIFSKRFPGYSARGWKVRRYPITEKPKMTHARERYEVILKILKSDTTLQSWVRTETDILKGPHTKLHPVGRWDWILTVVFPIRKDRWLRWKQIWCHQQCGTSTSRINLIYRVPRD